MIRARRSKWNNGQWHGEEIELSTLLSLLSFTLGIKISRLKGGTKDWKERAEGMGHERECILIRGSKWVKSPGLRNLDSSVMGVWISIYQM